MVALAKRIYRSSQDRMIAGVCGGVARYFDLDVSLVRLGLVFLMLATGIGPMLLFYLLAALVIPPERRVNGR